MKNIEIIGGRQLSGVCRVQGAKNAVLPILAGSILSNGKTTINDCPSLSDVHSAFNILKNLGCKVEFTQNSAQVNAFDVNCHVIPDSLMREMRSSIMFLGAIISRCKEARISSRPGGCDIGSRPIDIHLKAFRELGVNIIETSNHIYCELNGKIRGGEVELSFPSVGATENIMLLTAKSDTVTIISNAAKEPEIVDLQNFLNSMGAQISGAGTENITITGVSSLHSTTYSVIPDGIAAATYLCAAAGCGGKITLENVIPQHIEMVISTLLVAGCNINQTENSITLTSDGKLKAVPGIKTAPHPGFPTDAQALIMAMLAKSDGTTIFIENLFESRFKHIVELQKMGANIAQFNNVAALQGVQNLVGAEVSATDLRGGAALVIAGLVAKDKTIIDNTLHIDRGYENIVRDLEQLGANIRRI